MVASMPKLAHAVAALAFASAARASEKCSVSGDASLSEACSKEVQREQVLLQVSPAALAQIQRSNMAVSQNNSASCCGGCDGKPFCSPVSGNCYSSKRKSYYDSCGNAEEDLAEDASGDASCCGGCVGKPFCSPNSGSCYRSKAKDYYASCPVEVCEGDDCPMGYSTSDESSGHGQWCEVAKPPSTWQALKTCAEGTGEMTVKLLSYNLFWWNLFGRRGGEDGRAGKKVATTSGPEEYDFIGFQECDDIKRILGDAERWGLSGEYGTLSGGRAIAIAYLKSRWTLISSGVENVGEDSRRQYYGKRSAHWGRFRNADGRTVFFANHHGPLPVSAGGGCAGSATAYNIMRMIAENAHAQDAVFLVGDFNAQPHSSRVKALDGFMHRVYTGSSHGGVDHIFSNCGGDHVAKTENLGSGGSDHDAITASFTL
eukprot:TRINITY_DN2797_c0_g2_i2.p1 TRINITY_DN2797_c0_g2~~TRINITY_DN2797_c0_g2_i2.p1  ORF type:complete len:428 (-),score=82.70 TRINITY_DN2797_c0_g2_i2:694-1977(-)